MNSYTNLTIPCFLCGKPSKVKKTKTNKPYFICDDCGLQSFIRYKAGIRKFRRLLLSLAEKDRKFLNINKSSYETLTLIARLNDLRDDLALAKNNELLSDYLLSDTESEMAEKALEREIRVVRKALRCGSTC